MLSGGFRLFLVECLLVGARLGILLLVQGRGKKSLIDPSLNVSNRGNDTLAIHVAGDMQSVCSWK